MVQYQRSAPLFGALIGSSAPLLAAATTTFSATQIGPAGYLYASGVAISDNGMVFFHYYCPRECNVRWTDLQIEEVRWSDSGLCWVNSL